MDITPKVRLFLGGEGLCMEFSPICFNLISRYVNVEPECKWCGDQVESNEHALRDCSILVDQWSKVTYVAYSNSNIIVEE